MSWLVQQNAGGFELLGLMAFGDTVKPTATAAVRNLHQLGIKTLMLTGDNQGSADAVAQALGILDVRAEVLPSDKAAIVQALRASGEVVAFVGDGLNDGPALAAAHASIAPGTASDASQQAADSVFIGERLMPVVIAVRVARRCMVVVRQNFVFAIGYNLFAVPLALAGLVTPLIAALAMSTSSLVVVANSLRLAGSAK